MHHIDVGFLGGPDIAALRMTDKDILGAIESSLAAQGCKQAVIEPRTHRETGFRGRGRGWPSRAADNSCTERMSQASALDQH